MLNSKNSALSVTINYLIYRLDGSNSCNKGKSISLVVWVSIAFQLPNFSLIFSVFVAFNFSFFDVQIIASTRTNREIYKTFLPSFIFARNTKPSKAGTGDIPCDFVRFFFLYLIFQFNSQWFDSYVFFASYFSFWK